MQHLLKKYLPEIVYGGIDGCITTFAVVAGCAGANLEHKIVLILGISNLLADGFAMSVGSYLSSKSSSTRKQNLFKIPYKIPSQNKHAAKLKSPLSCGLFTFLAFIVMGSAPLLTYLIAYIFTIDNHFLFTFSSTMTALTFIVIGYFKTWIMLGNHYFKNIIETLLLGSLAALLAYYAGDFLEQLLT